MNIENIQIGDIIVYKKKDKSFFHKLIYKQQLKDGYKKEVAEYIHTEPIVMKTEVDLMTINAKFPCNRLHKATTNKSGRTVKIVRCTLPIYEDRRKQVAIHWLSRINNPYGLVGLIWFKVQKLFKINVFSMIGDFCSELAGFGIWREYVNYLKYDSLDVLPKPFAQMYPADFLNSKYFKVVYEGKL